MTEQIHSSAPNKQLDSGDHELLLLAADFQESHGSPVDSHMHHEEIARRTVEFDNLISPPETDEDETLFELYESEAIVELKQLAQDVRTTVSILEVQTGTFEEVSQLRRAPDSWNELKVQFKDYLSHVETVSYAELTPAQLDGVIGELEAVRQEYSDLFSRTPYRRFGVAPDPLVILADKKKTTDQQVVELYHSDDSQLRRVTSKRAGGKSELVMGVLRRAYPDGIDIVALGVDSVLDAVRRELSPYEITKLSIPERPKGDSPEQIAEYEQAVWVRVESVLRSSGLDDRYINDFRRTNQLRCSYECEEGPFKYVNSSMLTERLANTYDKLARFGVERIQRLYDELGISSTSHYRTSDLLHLEQLLDQDPLYIEDLQSSDVTVAFIDTKGDYNGAMESVPYTYNKPGGATLTFPVSEPGDFYRRMVYLKKLGVRPSTMVIGAHGAPGAFAFGSSVDGFMVAMTETANPAKDVVVEQASLGRLFSDEFMQPNRGLDSVDALKGKIQVILHSCSGDVEFNETSASVASRIVERIGTPEIEMYAATDVMYPIVDGDGRLTFKADNKRNVTSKLSIDNQRRAQREAANDIPVSRKEAA